MSLMLKLPLLFRSFKYRFKTDRGEFDYIQRNVSNGQIVFDVGAHKAAYLNFFQKLCGDEGSVFAFEPQPDLFQYLDRLKRELNWSNVSIHQLAFSDKAGDATLFVPGQNESKRTSPSASLEQHEQASFTHRVVVSTIDDFCDEKKVVPNMIKIDVEGHELSLLKGAEKTLKKYHPKILIEIEARHVGEEKAKSTFNFLEQAGYEGFFIKGGGVLPLAEFDFKRNQDFGNKNEYCNNFIFE